MLYFFIIYGKITLNFQKVSKKGLTLIQLFYKITTLFKTLSS
ncbi:hypothetical protein HMPREF0083_00847 [Aneurinibacillus aneurinilyticus ATCC 12856]|uniref:Uncharacterized protein n=1 Tax=Aneurinibacillus aneurinilyticus ATCC 12856 TaxID=649747 RepID=U1X7T4_ANEAE|nr:hypothetical protein HMPREF0083_00847 [Aneurinibacillus aneurinilyticus ATCC 12856]